MKKRTIYTVNTVRICHIQYALYITVSTEPFNMINFLSKLLIYSPKSYRNKSKKI